MPDITNKKKNTINIYWWNTNGRWPIMDKKFMYNYDVIFISETHCNGKLLPNVQGFQLLYDVNYPLKTSQGGQAAYVSVRFYPFLENIRYSKCTVSFAVATIPNYSFMSVYINPVDSYYFAIGDFGLVSEEISYWTEKSCTPFIGGDYNSRLGNLNELSTKTLGWRYKENIDPILNAHGVKLRNICEVHNVLPLNHCQYRNACWDGKFTYHKAGRQSQIDYCITSKKGRQCVQAFKIIDTGWHLSDHLPITVSLLLPCEINLYTLLLRSRELVGETDMMTSRKS